jgi:hypothetical protein
LLKLVEFGFLLLKELSSDWMLGRFLSGYGMKSALSNPLAEFEGIFG